MVAPSKLFKWPINHIHCSQAPIHQGRTCFQSFFYDLYRFTLSGLRYYSPLVLAPILAKRHKMDKSTLLEILRFYFQTVFFSSATTTGAFAIICFLRNINGKFTSFTFLSAIYLASQLCWYFPKRPLKLFTISLTQVSLEIVLKQCKNKFTYLLLNSKALQTLWFMCSSAILMHFKRNRQYNGFWFIQPEFKSNPQRSTIFTNKQQKDNVKNSSFAKQLRLILKLMLKDGKTYLTYGLCLDILSSFLKTKLPHKIQNIPEYAVKSLMSTQFKMTFFFMAYFGMYRLAFYFFYFLSKSTNKDEIKDLQHFLASFIGGSSYIFVNKLTLNTFAFVLAAQVLWQDSCQKSFSNQGEKQKNILEILKTLPFSKILFPLNTTLIIGSFIFFNDTVNGLGKTLIRGVTDQKLQRIFEYISKNNEETILRSAATMKCLGVF